MALFGNHIQLVFGEDAFMSRTPRKDDADTPGYRLEATVRPPDTRDAPVGLELERGASLENVALYAAYLALGLTREVSFEFNHRQIDIVPGQEQSLEPLNEEEAQNLQKRLSAAQGIENMPETAYPALGRLAKAAIKQVLEQ